MIAKKMEKVILHAVEEVWSDYYTMEPLKHHMLSKSETQFLRLLNDIA